MFQSVKGVVAPKGRKREAETRRSTEDLDHESDEEIGGFTTDVTFDLMNQLKDVLVISALQGWDIFHELYGRCATCVIQTALT